MVENELAEKLRAQGVNVTKSIDLFPPRLHDEKMGSQEDLQEAIDENGFDAILTVNLLEEETEVKEGYCYNKKTGRRIAACCPI